MVVIDALWARVGGGLSFITQQVAALERVRPEWKLQVLGAPWNSGLLQDELRSEVRTVPLRTLAGRLAYEQAVLPTIGCDILYAPGNFCPLLPTRAPIVLTVHNPSYYGEARWAPYNRTLRRQTGNPAKVQLVVDLTNVTLLESISLQRPLRLPRPHFLRRLQQHRQVFEPPVVHQPPEGLDDRTPFFLSIHNDYPHKRLADAVGAWAVAFGQDRYPPRLVMVGDVSPEARAR